MVEHVASQVVDDRTRLRTPYDIPARVLDDDRQVLDDGRQVAEEGRMVGSHAELAEQLIRLIEIRLLDPIDILVEGHHAIDPLRAVVRERARSWASILLDGDDRAALDVVMRVISTLYPGDGPFDPPPDWWRGPLGQAVARRVGHPTAESVSYPVAGAMLGITRQGVHDLVNRGKLARHPEGGVRSDAVRDRLLQEGTRRA
jgi:hypothetical protein